MCYDVVIYTISEDSIWKLSNKDTPSSSWLTYGFNDNSWSDYTGSNSVSKAGTVYIRHKFTGVQNMAA